VLSDTRSMILLKKAMIGELMTVVTSVPSPM